MLSLRNLAILSGFAAMAVVFAPVTVAAQLGTDNTPAAKQEPHQPAPKDKQPDAPRPLNSGAPLGAQSQGGPDSIIRPAAAEPPERIQVEPSNRPVVDPRDDPRSVEERKTEPDAIDR